MKIHVAEVLSCSFLWFSYLAFCMEEHPALEIEGLCPTVLQFALVCSLCASFDAAGQRLAKRVLMECEKHFNEVVAVKQVYRELCQKHVIPQTVANKITNSHSVEQARGHLFDHVWEYGTLDSLKVFCGVITSEEYLGYPTIWDRDEEQARTRR